VETPPQDSSDHTIVLPELDPAAIMTAHADMHHCIGGFTLYGGRCEPYLLAAALTAERERIKDGHKAALDEQRKKAKD